MKKKNKGKPPNLFDNLFKDVRYEKDLTQWEFADVLGCAQGYISKLENDICTPSIYFLIRTKRTFGLDWKYIEDFYIKQKRYHDTPEA